VADGFFVSTASGSSGTIGDAERVAFPTAQSFDQVSHDSLAYPFSCAVFAPRAARIGLIPAITLDHYLCPLGFLFWGIDRYSLSI